MRESDIVFEQGNVWVGRTPESFTVYRAGITHSTPDSSYAPTEDGKSIAIARAKYLAKIDERKSRKGAMAYAGMYCPWCGFVPVKHICNRPVAPTP